MNRRQFIIRSSAAVAGSMVPFSRLFGARPGNFTPLRRNVGFFTERGGTIGWLASGDALVVVDAQYPESARHCLKGLQQRASRKVDLLLNTHHHGDHTAGNPVFAPVADKIVAHRGVPLLMKRAAGEDGQEGPEPVYPETTFTESWKTDVGDETVHARHYGPAHTGADAVIYFEKANVVHTGDLVFNRMNPYTDRPAGASIHNWIKVLDRVGTEYPADAKYIFGHGKPAFGVVGDRQDVKVMKNYLSAIVEHVERGIRQGKGKAEIVARETLPGFQNFLYADFWTLPLNLEVAYREVKGKKWLEIGS